jgi:hypothetical protein
MKQIGQLKANQFDKNLLLDNQMLVEQKYVSIWRF